MNRTRRIIAWFSAICIFLCWGAPSFAEVAPLPMDFTPGNPPLAEGYLEPFEYEDESIHIRIEEGRVEDTDIWVAYIKIAHPSQLRTASAKGFDSDQVIKGTALAKRMNAVLAINGDYFSYINNGYLIRQGEQYRDLPGGIRDVLLIDENGDFHIVEEATKESLAEYDDMNIINTFNFGPALVIDGERVRVFFDNGNAALLPRQRMCIAQVGPLEYMCIATAGPMRGSQGMTLEQFSKLVSGYGVENAYNLDGGDSTMMIFKNEKINDVENPNTRNISDIIYFASAYTQEADHGE